MRKLRGFLVRLAGWRGRDARERELRDELEAHFQMHVEDNLRAGMNAGMNAEMSAAEARRQAAIRFGSVESTKEAIRSGWTVGLLETTRQDVVYALRGLRRNPAFAITAVLSLALGIGASIAIFTVADGMLLRPLPYREPGRLTMVWETKPRSERNRHNVVSPANYRDWKSQNGVFEGIAAYVSGKSTLNDGQHVEELDEQYCTADLFALLGVKPYRGRFFTAADDLPDTPKYVVISYRLWQGWFGGAENVLGRSVQVNSRPATIIGVMPPGFYFQSRAVDLWEALGLNPARDYRKNAGRYLNSVARLKPGVSEQRAQVEMTAIGKRLERDYPVFNKNWNVLLEPLRDSMVREVKTSLVVLLGAVLLLLAVACANVANLLLARHTARRREMAVRASIGAGRWRVVRQLVTESLVLGLAGGALGLGLARLAIAGLVSLAPADLARDAAVEMDLRIVLFAVAVSAATGLIFGLGPALAVARTDLIRGLREDGRAGGGSHGRFRNFLVAAEVALCVMLLAGAGLLVRSFVELQSVDPGLKASQVLTFRVSIPGAVYREPQQRIQFYERVLAEFKKLPGLRSASGITFLPFQGIAPGTSVEIAGKVAKAGEEPVATIRTVMPGYFQTMGIPIRSGRDFLDADNRVEAPWRFVINEAFARQYLRGEQALGKQISAHMQSPNPFGEVIGVVGDVKEGAIDRDPFPTVYYVHAHMPLTQMIFVLRAEGEPLALAEPARRVIRGIDAAQPVAEMAPMQTIVQETFGRQRFSAVLLAGFSLAALLLAAVGIYGVLAYTVNERTREIGVRVALGAEPGRIAWLVLREGGRVVVAGAVAGLAGAMALTGLLKSMLFGVGAHDAATFAVVPVVLMAVAMAAAYLPARRAARMDPVEALRAE
jgi:putative ABC transport system permease protein